MKLKLLYKQSLCVQVTAVKQLLQLRFDFDSTRQSGHYGSMLMKA